MAYWMVSSRVEGTRRKGFGSTGQAPGGGATGRPSLKRAGVEGHKMNVNRMRHLSGLRFELVQKARAQIEAGAFDNDRYLDACLNELLADLAG